ncbi:kinase-like protein, partial [Trametes sanguinea]
DEHVSRRSDGTVLKVTSEREQDDDISEAIAMELVFRHTLIPVPRVRRTFREDTTGYIWMDYIRGRQLKFVWPTLSIFGKLRVAFVLRRYIRQLRAICHPRSAVPGPLGSGLEGRRHSFAMYGEVVPYRGPFSTYAELSAFWNERHRIAHMPQAGAPEDAAAGVLEPFDDSQPLVLTHGDLNLRNILVGEDGRPWLIDWGEAGFYPPWFELVTTRLQQYQGVDPGDWVWELMIPFICDPYYKQELWYMHTRRGLNYR